MQTEDRATQNRNRRAQAHRELDKLLDQLVDPKYTGHLAIEVHAIDGRLGQVISLNKRYCPVN